jgi:hypothetical protein
MVTLSTIFPHVLGIGSGQIARRVRDADVTNPESLHNRLAKLRSKIMLSARDGSASAILALGVPICSSASLRNS